MSKIIDWHEVIKDGKADWERLVRVLEADNVRRERVNEARGQRWAMQLEYRAKGRALVDPAEAAALMATLGDEVEKMQRAALLGALGQTAEEAARTEGETLTMDALHAAAEVARWAMLEDLIAALKRHMEAAP